VPIVPSVYRLIMRPLISRGDCCYTGAQQLGHGQPPLAGARATDHEHATQLAVGGSCPSHTHEMGHQPDERKNRQRRDPGEGEQQPRRAERPRPDRP
jgi:hypothetical protein